MTTLKEIQAGHKLPISQGGSLLDEPVEPAVPAEPVEPAKPEAEPETEAPEPET